MSPMAAIGLRVHQSGDHRAWVWQCGYKLGKNVPKIDCHVLERTLFDATSSVASWLETVGSMRSFDALSAHTSVASVEDG